MRTTLFISGVLLATAAAAACAQNVQPLAQTAAPAADETEPDALDALFRKIILDVMPREYVDDDDWGGTKMFTTDLHVHREGLKIETRRKRDPLNHGTWEIYRVQLADAEQFQIDLHDVRHDEAGRTHFVIDVVAPLRAHARRAHWRRGVQLWSVSADADATLHLRLHCDAALRLEARQLPPAIAIDPRVSGAEIRMRNFRLLGLSKIRGEAAEELGRAIDGRIARYLARQDEKLVKKINDRIAKNENRLRLSLSAITKSPLKLWQPTTENSQLEESVEANPSLNAVSPGN